MIDFTRCHSIHGAYLDNNRESLEELFQNEPIFFYEMSLQLRVLRMILSKYIPVCTDVYSPTIIACRYLEIAHVFWTKSHIFPPELRANDTRPKGYLRVNFVANRQLMFILPTDFAHSGFRVIFSSPFYAYGYKETLTLKVTVVVKFIPWLSLLYFKMLDANYGFCVATYYRQDTLYGYT